MGDTEKHKLIWLWLMRDAKLFVLPVASGVLGALSFPKADHGYLAWIALTPLVVFLYHAHSAREAFWGGFLAGSIQSFALLAWIPWVLSHYGNAPTPLAWLLFLLLTAFLACFPACTCFITRYCTERIGPKLLLALPPVWVTVEFARNYFPFGGFPWLLIGYSQTEFLRVIQISDCLGVYGVSFLVLWMNTAFGWAICLRDSKPVAFVPLAAGIVLLLCCVVYGESSLRRWRALDPGLWAALLQGNISFDDPEPDLRRKFQDGYVQMASRLPESKIDLLVLPEAPAPLLFQQNTSYKETMERLARRQPLGLIFSNVAVSAGPDGEVYYNSAYFLDGEGREIGRYDKIHLVPFGEYIPWRKLFFFAQTITKDVGDFQAGEIFRVITMGGYGVNALICFEAVFPNLACEFVRRGSSLIVNLTNDGWYGDSAAPYQHLAMARWRAVENRRFLLRAANSGFSAIVNPTGEIQARTGLLREEICEGRFTFIEERTWYARHGDVFAMLCVIITCVASAMAAWQEWIGAKSRDAAT